MAASDDEEDASTADSDDNTDQNACIMCIDPPKWPKIVPFSARTWNTFIKYVQKWKSLEGDQGQIAGQFIAEHQQFNFDNVVDGNAIPLPRHAGYHQVCYTRFTDSQHVQRVTKSMQKLASKGTVAVGVHKLLNCLCQCHSLFTNFLTFFAVTKLKS